VWIQRLDCPRFAWDIEPKCWSGKVTTALYANRVPYEAADARDVPPGGDPGASPTGVQTEDPSYSSTPGYAAGRSSKDHSTLRIARIKLGDTSSSEWE